MPPAFLSPLALPTRPTSAISICPKRMPRPARTACMSAPLAPFQSDEDTSTPLKHMNLPRRAALELRAGDISAAESLYNGHLAENPTDARVWLDWAKAIDRIRGPATAEKILQRAVQNITNDPYLWHFLAGCARRSSGIAAARAVYKKASAAVNAAAILCAWAGLEADAKNFATARKLYARAVAADSTDGHSYMKWAQLELKLRDVRSARRVFSEGVKHVSRKSAAILYSGYAQLELAQGRPDQARFLYMRGAEADPKDKIIWQAWACLEEKVGNLGRARELFERGVVADPSFSSNWQGWGLLEERDGNIDAARCLFERGTRADPTDSANWSAWANLEAKNGNRTEARRLYNEAANRLGMGCRAAPLFLGWAKLEAELGNIDSARERYRSGLSRPNEKQQDKVRMLHSWARMEFKEKNVKEARRLFNDALKRNSNDHKTLHALATLEEHEKNFSAARSLLRKAIQYVPNDTQAVRSLAVLEWHHFADEGGVDRARALFRRTAHQKRNDPSFMRVWASFEDAQGDLELAGRLRDLANRRH